MGRWLDAVRTQSRRLLWLDETAYTTRVLANGRAPWLNVAAWITWRRQALRLLEPDIAVLDVVECASHWLERERALSQHACSVREPGAPLRTLLSDERFHRHLGELLEALRVSTRNPTALVIHSPQRWLRQSYWWAFAASPDLDEDVIEDAAGDISRMLRALSHIGTDALLLLEDAMPPARVGDLLSCYSSISNVARHYRWDAGICLPGGAPDDLKGLDFAVVPCEGATEAIPNASFWKASVSLPLETGSFLYAVVPEDADPQEVLERLRALR